MLVPTISADVGACTERRGTTILDAPHNLALCAGQVATVSVGRPKAAEDVSHFEARLSLPGEPGRDGSMTSHGSGLADLFVPPLGSRCRGSLAGAAPLLGSSRLGLLGGIAASCVGVCLVLLVERALY